MVHYSSLKLNIIINCKIHGVINQDSSCDPSIKCAQQFAATEFMNLVRNTLPSA